MAQHASTVTQPCGNTNADRPDGAVKPVTSADWRVPIALLDPAAIPGGHGLDRYLWCLYESLMTGRGEVRGPARARRGWVAEKVGLEPKKAVKDKQGSAVDDARRRLISTGWLERGSHQGRRVVPHYVARRPRPGDAISYVEVPGWWGGRVKAAHSPSPGGKVPAAPPAGYVRPDAWWLLARMAQEMTTSKGLLDGGPKAKHRGVTTTYLAGLIGARSPKTGARRLAELEAAGLVEVTGRQGGRLIIRPITDPAEALAQASRHARDGRRIQDVSQTDPGQNPAVDPGQNPAVDPGQNPAVHKSHLQGEPTSVEPGLPLAAGVLIAAPGAGAAADAERQQEPVDEQPQAEDGGAVDEPGAARAPQAIYVDEKDGQMVLSPDQARSASRVLRAVGVLAEVIPGELLAAMSEADRDRVCRTVETELAHRTPAELKARIRRRLAHWRGHEIRRPVAVALTAVRRGYDCPRPECEDHLLPSGHECEACAVIGTSINEERRQAVLSATQTADHHAPGDSHAPRVTQAVSGDLSVSDALARVLAARAEHAERLAQAGDPAQGAAAVRAALSRKRGA